MMIYRKHRRNMVPFIVAVVIAALVIALIGGYYIYKKYSAAAYPLEYREYVEKYAAENHIDKYLVYAVIKTESGFNPSALSDAGARGLMQIMEDTFEWVKFKFDDEDTVYYDMYDAEANIKYGCRLLGLLYEEFGNVECVAAAYHAGRGNVNNWLADKNYSKDGKHLDKIPISDTAHYVDKITKAMKKYIKLYEERK